MPDGQDELQGFGDEPVVQNKQPATTPSTSAPASAPTNTTNAPSGQNMLLGYGPETPEEQPAAASKPEDPKIKEFKQYMHQHGRYSGNVDDPSADPQFISALKKLENDISAALQDLTHKPANSATGLIWQGDHINPETSTQDVDKTIKLLIEMQKKLSKQSSRFSQVEKRGQATVDTWDPETPSAVKFNPTAEETDQPMYPTDSQQIGRTQEDVPADIAECDECGKDCKCDKKTSLKEKSHRRKALLRIF